MSEVRQKATELRELREDLGEIELNVLCNFTLSDAIREGSKVTEHEQEGWGNGVRACALTTAVVSACSRGFM